MSQFMKLLLLLTLPATLWAETGSDAWLRYSPHQNVPLTFIATGTSPIMDSVRQEWTRAVRAMTGQEPRRVDTPQEGTLVFAARDDANLAPDAYWLKAETTNGKHTTLVAASNDRGVLYGTFALLRKIQLGESIASLDAKDTPYAPVRWVDQWDNLDGSIERGYGGRSIFWDNRRARSDLSRVSDYGRLLASIGVNACSINNVNADPRILAPEMLPEIARIAAAFRPWGVRIAISVDFTSPKTLGGLDTSDPLDPRVAQWWSAKVGELYAAIPDMA